MDESARMGSVERVGNLPENVDGPRDVKRTLLVEGPAQVVSLHETHRNERLTALMSCFVDRDDVRVIDRCGDPGLTHEAVDERGIVGKRFREYLDCDLPTEPEMFSEVHNAHAALAEQALDPILREQAGE